MLAYGKASQAGAQTIPEATYVGMMAKKKEPVVNRINQASSDLHAATISGYVVPDIIKLDLDLRGEPVSHQRGVCCSASSRWRPRCFTSLASSRIDCCVTARPSPLEREASAVSTAARISARLRSLSFHYDSASR